MEAPDRMDLADSLVEFVGPWHTHDVVVEGRRVPYLEAAPVDGGMVDVMLDRRYGLLLTVEEAERVLPFVANAIAVAAGFTCHPTAERDGPTERHPFPRVTPLYGV
jgi:hypothetical protein